MSDDDIEQEMRSAMAMLPDADAALRYFKLADDYEDAKIPTANSATNGSIPGMLHYLSGEIVSDFREAGKALKEWLAAKSETR